MVVLVRVDSCFSGTWVVAAGVVSSVVVAGIFVVVLDVELYVAVRLGSVRLHRRNICFSVVKKVLHPLYIYRTNNHIYSFTDTDRARYRATS